MFLLMRGLFLLICLRVLLLFLRHRLLLLLLIVFRILRLRLRLSCLIMFLYRPTFGMVVRCPTSAANLHVGENTTPAASW